MYTVTCKNCEKSYQSNVNRDGICPECKKTVRGRTNTKYRDRTYDRLTLYVLKGERAFLKEYAAENCMSVNELIVKAIYYYIEENDKKKSKGEQRES